MWLRSGSKALSPRLDKLINHSRPSAFGRVQATKILLSTILVVRTACRIDLTVRAFGCCLATTLARIGTRRTGSPLAPVGFSLANNLNATNNSHKGFRIKPFRLRSRDTRQECPVGDWRKFGRCSSPA